MYPYRHICMAKKGHNPYEGKKNKLTSRQIKKKKRLINHTRKSK